MPDLLVVFPGIHQTLSAEEELGKRGVKVELIPTPVAVTLGCGFSILTPDTGAGGLPPWWIDLGAQRVIYRVIMKEGRKSYEEVGRCEGARVPPADDHVPEDSGRGRPR